MRNLKQKAVFGVVLLVIIGLYYYVTLPAINIHESGFWFFIIGLFVISLLAYITSKKYRTKNDFTSSKVVKYGMGALILVILVFVIGSVLSSPIVNAKKYQQLLTIETRDFKTDIKPADFSQIPLLDKDSASILGNRKMGSMVDMVSQFEVNDLYSQINYCGKPIRVTPLMYANPIKWFTNQSQGIPAYIMIDMTSQETELVKLEQGIKYSQSEMFNRNINRHLRFRYPTYMFDQISFEIDDNGTPFWVAPVKKFTIGLFGGQTIGRVILCNAITGETIDYPIEECPQWIDRAFPADLLVQLYNYHGMLKNGYLNSILGQKGCLKTTEGYNYIAMEDDVWVYTGITSVSGDRSNVAFILVNQRTKECRYYEVSGAEEYSAMESAQGQVQHLGYKATFPLLINVANEPTYFMALKDDAGLVKQYAMVNIQKYQNVAIGETVQACQKDYISKLSASGISSTGNSVTKSTSGIIERIAQGVIDGNSHFYITLKNQNLIFDVPVVDLVQIVTYQEGDTISLEYVEGDPLSNVLKIKD